MLVPPSAETTVYSRESRVTLTRAALLPNPYPVMEISLPVIDEAVTLGVRAVFHLKRQSGALVQVTSSVISVTTAT